MFDNTYLRGLLSNRDAIFLSSPSPLSPASISFPSLSIMTVNGIACTPNSCAAALSQPCRSDSCIHVIPRRFTASSQLVRSWSSDTPIMPSPLSLYLLYVATSPGMSRRHGPHQLAQKSITVTLCFAASSSAETSFPSMLDILKSGIMLAVSSVCTAVVGLICAVLFVFWPHDASSVVIANIGIMLRILMLYDVL